MKKIVSLILVLIFVPFLLITAFADGNVYEWSNAVDVVNQYFPTDSNYWLIKKVNATIWLPAFYKLGELTDEDLENGCIQSFISEDESSYIYLSYFDAENADLNVLLSAFMQSGYDARLLSVNGIPAVFQGDLDHDLITLTYLTRDNMFFQIAFFPASDEFFSLIYDWAISSIQPYEESESSESVSSSENPISRLIYK